MTVALDSAETIANPAGWWTRAGAFAIDVLAGAAAVAALLMTAWSSPERGWVRWLCLVLAALTLLAVAVNRLLLPTATGWSLGRAVFGIAVVDPRGGAIGPWRLLVRDLAHLLDTIPLLLGWLWPLIDRRGRTFADLLVGTEVHQMPDPRVAEHQVPDHQVPGPRPDWRRLAGAAVAGAAALSVLAAALAYASTYREQRAADRARSQIADAGPKIVTDILNYTTQTVDEDFTRAQSLVTDAYRPELVKQQEAVRKAPVTNDYWVSNSAVLASTVDRATMLMLLQGQRGAEPNQRFVSASLRVDFEKTGANDWKMSNLAVLAAPSPAADAPQPDGPKPDGPKPDGPKPDAPKPDAPKPDPPKSDGGGR
ncbi:MAG: RDD family protein [Mycobacterium sp.]|nr:RDD family protein [Mycobacterium sp.]